MLFIPLQVSNIDLAVEGVVMVLLYRCVDEALYRRKKSPKSENDNEK